MRVGALMACLMMLGCVLLTAAGTVVAMGTASASGDPVIAAAGDIACPPGAVTTPTACHQGSTAALLDPYDAVLPVGDEQYSCGQLSAYRSAYAASWGQYLTKTYPVPGDNEYAGSSCTTPGASGYFTYFGAAATPQQPTCLKACKGYYSYDLGDWHVVALNSECTQSSVGGCGATQPEVTWLKADLAAHPAACTLAYLHEPYWSNGTVVARYRPLLQAMYDGHVDVVLNGHAHIYARYAPQSPAGAAEPTRGVREFIVGTGGRGHGKLSSTPLANLETADATTFGVLALTLHATGYDWSFVPDSPTGFTDSGTDSCH